MPASYPESVKQWTDKQDHVDDVFSGDINGAYDEIKAIETELMQIGYKRSVRVATTQNGSLATAFANGQTVDGVALVTGDRILIKDQTNGAENGIYTVNASGAPTRAIDANSNAHMVAGLMVYVREGTENAKGTWKLTTNGAITLGTTPLAFENEVKAHVADDTTHPKYLEGVFTPTIKAVTTDPTYTVNTAYGRYKKIGKLVFVTIYIQGLAITNVGSGRACIGGLPFAAANIAGIGGGELIVSSSLQFLSSTASMHAITNPNDSILYFRSNVAVSLGTDWVTCSNVTVKITGCYESAS